MKNNILYDKQEEPTSVLGVGGVNDEEARIRGEGYSVEGNSIHFDALSKKMDEVARGINKRERTKQIK